MRTLVFVIGLAVTAAVGFAALFNMGWISAAVVTAVVLAGAVAVGVSAQDRLLRRLALGGAGLLVVVGGVILWGWMTVDGALEGTGGDADPAQADPLAAAGARLLVEAGQEGVLIQWTEAEFTAAVQASLDAGGDNPFSSLSFDARPPTGPGSAGSVRITGEFKHSSRRFSAVGRPEVRSGDVHWELSDVAIGPVRFPGFALGRIERVLDGSVSLRAAMDPLEVEVQDVRLFDDAVIVVGLQRSVPIDPSPLIDAAEEAAGGLDIDINVPDAGYPAGRSEASIDGARYYVAIGGSLAAGDGLGTPAEGYVSRLHRALEERTGEALGLRNFASPGESSTSILDGQLDEALAFMEAADVAYVTIDVGSIDLLGHIVSPDCTSDLASVVCGQRMDSSWVRYVANVERLFDEVRAAAPDATIVLLTTPNPFSLGLQSEWPDEATISRYVIGFNNLAAERALERGLIVADGFGAINARGLATTYVTGEPASILLNGKGHGFLTRAIVVALEAGGAL